MTYLKVGVVLILVLGSFSLGMIVQSWREGALREKIMQTEQTLYKERLLTNSLVSELAALREEKQRVIYRRIVERVPELVPSSDCDLPAGWRVLHDAAALRQDPAPGSVDHAAPVPAQDAARTVAENYEEHNRIADRLEDCQAYIRGVVRPEGLVTQ